MPAVESAEFAVELDGHRLAGEAMGEGAPIVLLHGVTATRSYVVHGSKVLARSGYRQLSYDARGHGRSGSQFFVVTAPDAGLPPQYAILGKVSSGQDVVNRIASLGDPASGQTGTPLAIVVTRKITIGG